jgi:response regulator of citrate/malate metabolism
MEINIDAEYMQVIAVENKALVSTFRNQANEILSRYEVVMTVNNGDEAVMICQHANENKVVVEIYIMASSGDECILMHIIGKNLELSNMTSIMNML